MNPTTSPVLRDFTKEQLQILLEHLRLGVGHLKKQLDDEQFKELLKLNVIEKDEKELKADRVDKLSDYVQMTNSTASGFIGAWMGITTFMGYELTPNLLRFIASVAIAGAGILSYISGRKHQRENSLAVSQLRLHDLQLQILQQINQKQSEEAYYLVEDINKKLVALTNSSFDAGQENPSLTFVKEEDYKILLEQLKLIGREQLYRIPKGDLFETVRLKFLAILSSIHNMVTDQAKLNANLAEALKKGNPITESNHRPKLSPLEILTDPKLAAPKARVVYQPWYKAKKLEIALGLLPMILGSIGSGLMWINTGPEIAEKLGWIQSQQQIHQSNGVYLESLFCFLVTGLFTFFYFYTKKKDAQFDLRKEVLQKKVANEESKMFELATRIHLTSQINLQLDNIMDKVDEIEIFESIQTSLIKE